MSLTHAFELADVREATLKLISDNATHLRYQDDTKRNWYDDIKKTILNEENAPVVWITLINYGYIEFAKNFLKSMEISQVTFKLVIFLH